MSADVFVPGRALNLQTLSHRVQREDDTLGKHACRDAGNSIARAERKLDVGEGGLQTFVESEKEAHVGYNLADSCAETAKVACETFVALDVADAREQAFIDLFCPLGGKSRPQKVEWVCDGD